MFVNQFVRQLADNPGQFTDDEIQAYTLGNRIGLADDDRLVNALLRGMHMGHRFKQEQKKQGGGNGK